MFDEYLPVATFLVTVSLALGTLEQTFLRSHPRTQHFFNAGRAAAAAATGGDFDMELFFIDK